MLSVMLNKQVNDYLKYILRYYNSDKPPYVTGLEIKAQNVYSICPGKVISTGWSLSSKWSVTVLVNDNQMIRYTNLKKADVREGETVAFKTFIGIADDFVRFEYCTNLQESKWPVRVKSITMYKHDPLRLLTGEIKLKVVVDNVHEARGDEEMIHLDKHVLNEFTGSRGDDE